MAAVVAPLLLVLALMLIQCGHWLAQGQVASERAELAAERRALDAGWRALDDTKRVRAVFLHARRAMRAEAGRATQLRQIEAGSPEQRGQA